MDMPARRHMLSIYVSMPVSKSHAALFHMTDKFWVISEVFTYRMHNCISECMREYDLCVK